MPSSLSATLCFAPLRAFVGQASTSPRVVVVDIDSEEHRHRGRLAVAARDGREPRRSRRSGRRHPSSPSISCSRTPTPIRRQRWRGSSAPVSDAAISRRLPTTLPDGDKRLSAALRSTAGVLGFRARSRRRAAAFPRRRSLRAGRSNLADIWRGAGVDRPAGELIARSARPWRAGAAGRCERHRARVSRCSLRPTAGPIRASRSRACACCPVRRTTSSMARARPSRSPTGGFRWRSNAMLRLAPVVARERNVTIVSAADVLSDRVDPAVLVEIRRHDRRLGAGTRRAASDRFRSADAVGACSCRRVSAVDARIRAARAGLCRHDPARQPAGRRAARAAGRAVGFGRWRRR